MAMKLNGQFAFARAAQIEFGLTKRAGIFQSRLSRKKFILTGR
jgi:hypothetical protein